MSVFDKGFKIPKVIKVLDLSGYSPGAEDLKDQKIDVWVNINSTLFKEWTDIQKGIRKLDADFQAEIARIPEEEFTEKLLEAELEKNNAEMRSINDRVYAFYAEVWSQDPKQVADLHKLSQDQDNGSFWTWITTQTQGMIIGHRNQHLKN